MLKVFLVEDEYVVRLGIKKNIAWQAHGYEFCGEASDGELALPLIRKHRPDILITDIRMPFMDGLELSRIVRKEFPEIEIIILSGYEEFSYAKEAIRLGISSYLLKPISGDALLHEIDQVAARIIKSREEAAMKEQYQKEMAEFAASGRQHFFKDLVSSGKSLSELFELASHYEIDLSAGIYNIILLKLKLNNHLPQEFSNRLVQANARIEALASDKILIFDRELEGYGILIKADSEKEYEKTKESLLHAIRQIAGEYRNVSYAAGIGSPVLRLSELKKSFEAASQAFAHRFFTSDSCIIDANEHVSKTPDSFSSNKQSDIDLNLSQVDPKQLNLSRVTDFLRTGDAKEAPYFVEELFESIGINAMESKMFRQYILLGIYFSMVEFVEELKLSREELPQLDVTACMTNRIEYSKEAVLTLLLGALELRENAASNRYSDMVETTIHFIEENYMNYELTLNMAASHVRFSPNYLSKVFSEQTGETFIKFLTDYRMNKAKVLLRCTSKKSSEIAYEVGYKDPHYFSFLFKKQTGMSPKQFRGGDSAGE